MRPGPCGPGTRLQTPTLIGCLLLKNLREYCCFCAADFRSAKRWDYHLFFDSLSSTWLVSSFATTSRCPLSRCNPLSSEAHDYSSKSSLLANSARCSRLARAAIGFAHDLARHGERILSLQQPGDRKSTRLNSSHERLSRMPSSA